MDPIKFKVPKDLEGTPGLNIGGGFFPFKDGHIELPADGTQYMMLPPGFVRVDPKAVKAPSKEA